MDRLDQEPFRAAVPADVERADQILGPFTLRQVAVLGGTGLALYGLWAATTSMVPTLVFLAGAVPVVAVAVFLAVGRRDGLPLDAWLLHALTHRRRPHHFVPAHADSHDTPPAPAPAWTAVGGTPQPQPAPLRLPANGVTAEGLVDLGEDGLTAVAEASTVNFGLRSHAEQNALVAGFARWLHSLDAPVQLLARAHRVDLGDLADRIAETAPGLPDPALEQAATDHAAFLAQLAATHELLARRITLAVRDQRGPAYAVHRAHETAHALGGCEVAATVHTDPAGTSAAVAAAVRPDGPPPPAGTALADAVITTRRGDWP